jgi:hypothetical protein
MSFGREHNLFMNMLSGGRVLSQAQMWSAIERLATFSHSVTSNNQRTLGRAFQTSSPVVGDNSAFYPQTFSEIQRSSLQVELTRRWEKQTGLVTTTQA